VSRQSVTGLSGWAAYSYAKTRYTDTERLETFWADFDRRHAFTAAWTYPLSTRTNLGAIFRADGRVWFTTRGMIEGARWRFDELDEDRVPGEKTVTVLSHGFWQRRYGADPAIIGKNIDIGGPSMVRSAAKNHAQNASATTAPTHQTGGRGCCTVLPIVGNVVEAIV